MKRQSPDTHFAKATAKESSDRLAFAKSILNTHKPKYVLENAYEAVRQYIDAILFLAGYKSYSHEACVAYLLDIGFSFSETANVDRMRKQRNGVKYYGDNITKEEAIAALALAESILKKLQKLRKL